MNGDIAILKRGSENARNGDIVLVEIDGRPELRTFHILDSEHIILTSPAGSGPAVTQNRKDAPIRGILVGLQRTV